MRICLRPTAMLPAVFDRPRAMVADSGWRPGCVTEGHELGNGLRQRIEDDDRLVGARDDGFCDGDEFVLLAEDAETRRLGLVRVELGGSPRGKLDAAGLQLRRHDVELRTVPN